jgi:hypothetical protein
MKLRFRSLVKLKNGASSERPQGEQADQKIAKEASRQSWDVASLLREHLAVVISGLLVAFAAVKIIIFARGDYSVALSVLNAGQQFTILASTMFSVLVIAAMTFVSVPALSSMRPAAPGKVDDLLQQQLLRYISLFAAWGLLLIAAPAYYLGAAAFLICFGLVIKRNRRKRLERGRRDLRKPRRMKLAVLLFSANIVALVISLASAEWNPQENVTFSEQEIETTASGFVIGQQGKQFLMVDGNRSRLRWISEDDIRSRRVCAPAASGEWFSKSVLGLVSLRFGPDHPAELCL